ncbi:glycoside hydrolase family 31 protein [Fictibacillus sp. Mic-4]|uniref:glycoside hydrolase family 31 protein n=1 Tax=Fictibacillus sp. Mic-4 TaxID=3132826 RepID=UPI003CF458CC
MLDTSFAIHPGNTNQSVHSSHIDIGNMKSFKQNEDRFEFACERGSVVILFYRKDIVRVVMNPSGQPRLESSFAVVAVPEEVGIQVKEEKHQLHIRSERLAVIVQKQPFRLSFYDETGNLLVREGDLGMAYNEKKEMICYKEMDKDDNYYGFGEKTGFLNKRGEKMVMWNTDMYAPHNPETDTLYVSIPFFMTLREGKAHGIFFDHTGKTTFDMREEGETYSFAAESGQLDYYVMAGRSPKAVVEQYTHLTGRAPLPPKWSLGYHQSRYSYQSETEVRELAETFRAKEIPLDVIHLDIHYMDGYRIFTFDGERFPDPGRLIAELKEKGIRVVPIVDPGVKEDPEYFLYQEGVYGDHFCKYLHGDIYHGDVWPGNSAFPDFTNTKTRKWWGEKHQVYTDLGICGIWNDMNEPAVFNETKTMDVKVMHGNDGNPQTHRQMHNIYGLLMGEATYTGLKELLHGRRPFLLTRAGYAGVQRYAAVWTGDNRSFWEHLALSLPMCMNLGLSGVPFAGPDVGGFAHDTTKELLIRWTQVGAFTPFFRNHSAIESKRQEPWAFGEEAERIIKRYIELRYRWLPHLYTLFKEAASTGLPIMRPLLMEYADDENVLNLSDQFMLGSTVMIAPILQPGTSHRVVYLPEGNWIDYWTDERYEGGGHRLYKASLETLPIFIKEGAILPHGTAKQSTSDPETKMTFHIYGTPDGKSEYCLYEDDGETFAFEKGEYFELKIGCSFNKDLIKIDMENTSGRFRPTWKEYEFVFHNVSEDVEIIINEDRKLPQLNGEARLPVITVKLD